MMETQTPDRKWTLPPGWEAVTSDNKRVYYWNKKTGETTWNFPEQEGELAVVLGGRGYDGKWIWL